MELPDIQGLSDLTKSRLVETTMEFHQLEKLDLFTNDELCEIMQNWIHFQTRIGVENCCLQDCSEYIAYQIKLLKTVQFRALEKPGLNKEAAEKCIISKIRLIYQEAVKQFKDDYSLHVPYIKFCIRITSNHDVVEWAMNLLKEDITNKNVWMILDDLYTNDTDDIRSALWVIMADFSGKFIHEILNPEGDASDNRIPNGPDDPEFQARVKRLGELFNMSFKYIRCSYFHISLLDNIKNEEVMKQLLIDFKQNPFMWNALAQKLWRVDIKAEPSAGYDNTRSPKTRLEQSVAKYKEGIATLLPENKSGLWCILINFLFSVYEDPENAISNSFKLNMIKMHLTEGMPYFSESQFLKWLKLVDDPTECLHISEKAVAILPNSVKLWRERLKYEYLKDDTSHARSLFCVAVGQLKAKSLPLWQDMIQYTLLSSSGPEIIEELFWEGVKHCHEISHKLRPMFLEWLSIRKSIKHTRAVYNLLVEIEPHCKEIHVMMSKIENSLAEDFNEEIAERVHKIACSQFSNDLEIRLNYIKFLLNLTRRGANNVNERVVASFKESLATLPPDMHDEFKARYNELLKLSSL